MNINLITVGKKMPSWINQGFEEFAKRLNQECRLNLIEINAVNRKQNTNSQDIKQKEADLIRGAIPKNNIIVALDEHGKEHNTKQLAAKLEAWLASGQDISLVIGGADGLDSSFIKEAQEVWSLSKLTLPHAMVRVIVAEQIYRAWSVLKKHPYHRE